MQEELTPNYGCQADRLTPIPRAALAREARTPTPTVTPDAFLPAATEALTKSRITRSSVGQTHAKE